MKVEGFVRLRRNTVVLGVLWTGFLVASVAWKAVEHQRSAVELARLEARSTFNKDLSYRRWSAMHGGVYVPVSEQTPSNPFLAKVAERDITTPSGRRLTLMNPAYMTKQVHAISAAQYGVRGHITSSNPLNPENTPDPWEALALTKLKGGDSEFAELVKIDGEDFMRLMRPAFTEQRCLKCHEQQGYKLGDMRGGISVSVPMAAHADVAWGSTRSDIFWHVLVWIAGLGGLLLTAASRKKRVRERSLAEDALRESEDRYRRLAENAPDLIWRTDIDGTVQYVNQASQAFLGLSPEDAVGLKTTEYLSPEDIAKARGWVLEAIRANPPREVLAGEVEYLDRAGDRIPCEFNATLVRAENGRVVAFEGISRDITERRTAEAERLRLHALLLQSQKMESIGTLASGVAHEINNPINIVSNYAELILDEVEPDGPIPEWVNGILTASWRIATIVKSLLAFSRQDKGSHSPACVDDVVVGTVSLIRKVLQKDHIEVQVDIPNSMLHVTCRSQQIQQVLMNLLTNARDALNARYPHHDDDKVVRVLATEIERDGAAWVRITVENHGESIPPEVKPRIFDPFFTTKPREVGTGLGLSVSHGIVKEHKGELSVESEEGRWTRFHVDLPADNGSSSDSMAEDI